MPRANSRSSFIAALAVILTWLSPACAASAMVHAQAPRTAATVGTTATANLHQQLLDLAARYDAPSVAARVDHVWRAVPGLSGRTLDVAASVRATRAHGGHLQLVWTEQPPQTRLADLPAEPIYRAPSAERSAALMVNVSWGEEYIPGLLGALAKAHVKATFFLDGDFVRRHPDVAKCIVAAGHDIGSHGTGHKDFQKLSTAALAAQLAGTNREIHEVLGVNVTTVAPPAGSFDKRVVALAQARHMHVILWTADTVDWQRPQPQVIVARIDRKLEPGALILMHPTAPTVAALPTLIAHAKQRGYVFKTVADVVAERRAPVGLQMDATGLYASDPNTGQTTSYMPIWYVMQVLQKLSVANTWDGTTWRIGPAVHGGGNGSNENESANE